MDKLTVKTPAEIKIMASGGRILSDIRNKIAGAVKPGIKTIDLEKIACELIDKTGGQASFKMVPGYYHATCINVNEVVVHGIPGERQINEGDKVGIDVGLFYKGFHTDTSVTVRAGKQEGKRAGEIDLFLEVGNRALNAAIKQAKPGKRVADLSKAMQETVETAGFSAVTALTGHGIGKNLHEEPAIPCFNMGKYENSPLLTEGMTIAIEIMYNEGVSDVVYENDDGWTIATADGKMSGLFEHTVAVTREGPVILTGRFPGRKDE
jgi:methionyl aminopeptidase